MSKEKEQPKQQQDGKPKTENIPNTGLYGGYYPGNPNIPALELARAYIPIQRLGQMYSPAMALETGTLFPELYRPWPAKVGR
ncbi:spore coat associated protein CotJA [Desulfotruncus alcoholivorax]|uniref:spore coat associated protein CotJA n=1 Tax=Desulfotruncus alcoholivorax TaxID=265477 RepID=UPI000406608A|nr:spore coat associated protein CotJA [Desulfotruncus alcoholivorax]